MIILTLSTLISTIATAEPSVEAGEDKTVLVDEEVEFRAKGDGSYYWDFDDSVDSEENPDGNTTNDEDAVGKVVKYKFDEAGTYIVTLTVKQNDNIVAVYKSEIRVEEPAFLDPWVIGLIFVIIGVIMLLAEASSPGFFIGIPATILIVIGIIGIAFPALFFSIWSPIIAAIVAAITTAAIIILYRRLAPPEAPTTTVGESLIGKVGTVTVDIEPNSLKGKVKIGSDIWSATTDNKINKGAKVVVTASEGVHVTVERFKDKKGKIKTKGKV